MSQFIVTVSFKNGETICDPVRVEVAPDDTVRWTCADGDLAVDFENDTPFTSTQVWRAPGQQMTPAAVVKAGTPRGSMFRPKISIDGTVVAKSLGDLIVR